MPIISKVGRRAWSVRASIFFIYLSLGVLGVNMVVPFMITVSSSMTNDMDYPRFRPVPRYLWDRRDRFIRSLVGYFNTYRGWNGQMRAYFPDMPPHWTSWWNIGKDVQNVDRLADRYLDPSPRQWDRWKLIARDYSEFVDDYPAEDVLVAVRLPETAEFLTARYERLWARKYPGRASRASAEKRRKAALETLAQTWRIPYKSFFDIRFDYVEGRYPMGQQGWYPPKGSPKHDDFVRIKAGYGRHRFTPGIRKKWLVHLNEHGVEYDHVRDVFPVRDGSSSRILRLWRQFKAEEAPAAPVIPFAIRTVWRKYLDSEEVREAIGLAPAEVFTVDVYNRLAGTDYKSMYETPFPVPSDSAEEIRKVWRRFVETRYPLRLTQIEPTPKLTRRFQDSLKRKIKYLRTANQELGTQCDDWSGFDLPPMPPEGLGQVETNRRDVWLGFVKDLSAAERVLGSSEIAYQKFLLNRYGNLEAVNRAYGWSLRRIEEAFPPLDIAYAVTFAQNEGALTFGPVVANYGEVFDFLLLNANAVPVTLLHVGLTILCTLTINPLAAYGLSRFNMRGQGSIILFMLAAMAFPTMVSAIPAYLLLRDLHLLNTIVALVLPGAANGMAIFILKGFFDSIPTELFEAATIDGAGELQIFRIVAMPMVKPILAINSLTAFVAAYNSWAWALIVCQKKSMWTIAVWLYQANSSWWRDAPWTVAAGFVVVSIPTLLVFLSCQKIILRGIVIPSMK